MEEAQGMMKLVEQLKDERELLSSTPSVSYSRFFLTPSALINSVIYLVSLLYEFNTVN